MALLGVATFFGSGFITSAAIGAVLPTGKVLAGFLAAGVGLISGAACGVGCTTVITTYVDSLNPLLKYKKAKTLNEDVIGDDEILINGDIKDFAYRLELMLTMLN